MRYAAFFLGVVVLSGTASADPWRALTGPEIEAALNDRTLLYEGPIRQVFYGSGKTLYDNGRPSWGNWAVRGDQYCSEWPPADGWTCYDFEKDLASGRVRFVSETGSSTVGWFLE